MRVVIVEQNHLGHYYHNDRLVIEAVRAAGADVILAVTPEGLASDEFGVHLASAVAGVDVRPILRAGRGGIINGIKDAAANLNRAVKETNPDVLLVVTADGIAQAAGLARMAGLLSIPRHVHCECLINRLAFTYPNSPARLADPNVRPASMMSTKLSLLALRKSPFAKIHLLDVLAYEWMQRHGGALRDRVDLIADPIEEMIPMPRKDARRLLGIPEEGRYLICPGLLDNRKGISPLITAFAQATLRPTDRLVLAGRATPEIAVELESMECIALRDAGRLIVIDRVLSEQEFHAGLWAADVVVCTYPHQPHPASIALKALACGRPTLASNTAWLGTMVPRYGMGWTVDVANAPAFAAALSTSLDQSASWSVSEAGRRLVEFSSAANYQNSWAAAIRGDKGQLG